MTNLKNLINELKDYGRDDVQLLNITYYLLKNRFACRYTSNIDISDAMVVYDNLEINNELITSDNLDDYIEHLTKIKISKSKIEKIANGEKILLLNYYTINGQLKDCLMWFDPNYNILD